MTSSGDLTAVKLVSEFSDHLFQIFSDVRPKKIIETGTYHGTGTTSIIASVIRRLDIHNATFYTIEVNPHNCAIALNNLKDNGLVNLVSIVNGLSIPRHLLPTMTEIEDTYVKQIDHPKIYVDHHAFERAIRYYKETDWKDVPEDLIGKCLKEFNYKPDFVLLDSGGHLGNIEFNYLINRLKGECVIALDDTNHVKHYRSLIQIQNDSRFQTIVSSKERTGYCIARFKPAFKNRGLGEKESISRGEKLFSMGKTAEAIQCFRKVLITDPFNVDALNNLGVIAFQLNDVDMAEKLLTAAIRQDPENHDTVNNLARLYQSKGEFQKAWLLFNNLTSGNEMSRP